MKASSRKIQAIKREDQCGRTLPAAGTGKSFCAGRVTTIAGYLDLIRACIFAKWAAIFFAGWRHTNTGLV